MAQLCSVKNNVKRFIILHRSDKFGITANMMINVYEGVENKIGCTFSVNWMQYIQHNNVTTSIYC